MYFICLYIKFCIPHLYIQLYFNGCINFFQILKNVFKWINNWESNLINNIIQKDDFLTKTTSDGLKITLQSSIDLIDYLLNEKNLHMF